MRNIVGIKPIANASWVTNLAVTLTPSIKTLMAALMLDSGKLDALAIHIVTIILYYFEGKLMITTGTPAPLAPHHALAQLTLPVVSTNL